MVMALAPIHKRYGIERVVVSTYQSITGTGSKRTTIGKRVRGVDGEKAYPHPIHRNALHTVMFFWTMDIPKRK
ncbi:MAG: hypothetical protein CM15mP83_0320 [Flavobacteriaceae bacterium]|nr:MAG: hypothetical protein CM15mP83_0320 [Flavobacteriaceae bacterium]